MNNSEIRDKFKEFAVAAGVRALRTVCQTAVTLIGTNTMGITEVDWPHVISVALLTGVVSILTSVATGLPEVEGSEPMSSR